MRRKFFEEKLCGRRFFCNLLGDARHFRKIQENRRGRNFLAYNKERRNFFSKRAETKQTSSYYELPFNMQMDYENEFRTNEVSFVDTQRAIVSTDEELAHRMQALSLPSVPVHTPGKKLLTVTIEDDDGDDDDDGVGEENDEDYEEIPSKKRGKEQNTSSRKAGRVYKKSADTLAKQLVDSLLAMVHRGQTAEDCALFLRNMKQLKDGRAIANAKLSLQRMISYSNKTATATETAMIVHLSGLSDDHPDKRLELTIRESSYQDLLTTTVALENKIMDAQRELDVLQDQMKIHKFFANVHPQRTQDQDSCINFIFGELNKMEVERFTLAQQQTSTLKNFAYGK